MNKILLSDLLDLQQFSDSKIHLASWNGKDHPLDVFVEDKDRWKGWNEYKGHRNDFNRRYIFSLIQFYHEKDRWLFGGVFEILKRHSDRYEVRLCDRYKGLIGRLKIEFKRSGRAKAVLPEKQFGKMQIIELLSQEYSGEIFPGYENINISFKKLESIIKRQKKDWRAALSNIKGVYLIADQSNGKKYVGVAHGATGIWSRWSCYIGTGHGHNDDFGKIIKEHGLEYARENFIFSLLEYRPMKTDDQVLIDRETYWKKALITRKEFGYNNN
ncbi:MAG: GIY-YIG nuclease family protein [Gammaproteobacteria bacterium]|nr:GIY-YIG nuclease family protein [Gammaproteobacteria bacterium]